jgi:hypothetical protein
MLIFPAHGVLGGWDEVIFLAVVVVFVGMMAVSWIRGQSNEEETPPDQTETPDTSDENRFELK